MNKTLLVLIVLLVSITASAWDCTGMGQKDCICTAENNYCRGVPPDSSTSSNGSSSNQGAFWRWLKERRENKRQELRQRAHNLNQAGVAAFSRSDYDSALQDFLQALKYEPDNPVIQGNLEETRSRIAAREKDDAEDREAKRRIETVLSGANIESTSQGTVGAVSTKESGLSFMGLAPSPANRQPAVERLTLKLKKINVPPPVPAEEASIRFGELAPGDETSKRVLLGLDVGVAGLKVFCTIRGVAFPPTTLILVLGSEVIEAENAADVYLTKQDATYERSLKYLKDPSTRVQFTAIVRTLKEGKPLSENSSVDMVRAAKALLDPKLGNSGMRIAWDALWSPEAKHAMLTRAAIQLGGEILGQASGAVTERVLSGSDPVFNNLAARDQTVQTAREWLATARSIRPGLSDPKLVQVLDQGIVECNEIIAQSYRQAAGEVSGESVSFFSQWAAEEHVTKKPH